MPPIKSPKQLDVFVFGEKGASGRGGMPSTTTMLKNHLDRSNGITGPLTSSARQTKTKNTTLNDGNDFSKEQHI